MNSLNKIKEELESTKAKSQMEVTALKNRARAIFSAELEAKQDIINKMTQALDSTEELTTVRNDEYYHRWIRADFSQLIDTDDELQRELLEEYFSDNHCAYVDFENDCLTTAEGPCILINHDGDVLDQDSGKWFISKNDYETVEERNALIEAYMEKSGCFPSVISVDYHGNAVYTSTLKE